MTFSELENKVTQAEIAYCEAVDMLLKHMEAQPDSSEQTILFYSLVDMTDTCTSYVRRYDRLRLTLIAEKEKR